MKRFTKMLSILLVLAFSFGISSTALASSIPISGESAVTVKTDTVLGKAADGVITLRSEDLSNGDARFSIIKNGETVSSTYVDRSTAQILWQGYEKNRAVKQETRYVEQVAQAPNIEPQAIQWVMVGDVRYNHYVQDVLGAITKITWSYRTESNAYAEYNIRGRYQDITVLAGVLLTIFTLGSASTAMAIALHVIKVMGATADAVELMLPDYYVSAYQYTVIWRANGANKYKYYEGHRYTITHEGYGNQTVQEGDYYPITAIEDHNTSLALKPYNYFFSGHNKVSVNSWPK